MAAKQKITTFLWFDREAEEAAAFYTSIFEDSKILAVSRYGDAGPGPKGPAMTVEFQLAGQRFLALNGGPHFKFTEAISLLVDCEKLERESTGEIQVTGSWKLLRDHVLRLEATPLLPAAFRAAADQLHRCVTRMYSCGSCSGSRLMWSTTM